MINNTKGGLMGLAQIAMLKLDSVLTTAAQIVPFQVIPVKGKEGELVVVEPRKITAGQMQTAARFYCINNTSGIPEDRGGHYHPHKKEILFVLRGSAEFLLRDAAGNEDHFIIDTSAFGIYIPMNVWHNVKISGDCLLAVLSPMEYTSDESVVDFPA